MMKPYFETKLGKLFLGNCLEIMPELEQVDMILSDLPYGTIACEWDVRIPFEPLWGRYERVIKGDGVIALTASQPFTSMLVVSNLAMFKYEWVWDKISGANFMNLKNRPFKTQEQILIFSKTASFTFNPERVSRSELSLKRNPAGIEVNKKLPTAHKAEHYNANKILDYSLPKDGKKHPIDIIKFNVIEKNRYKFKHPTKKPVALFGYLITTYTNESDLVLDNCAGSGTTGVACERLNRKYILIEISEKYCEIAAKRIEAEASQLKLFR